MSIFDNLSSQIGERSEEGNRLVAKRCLESPILLEEINKGLKSRDVKIVEDCVEVLTKVAEDKPELILPFTDTLLTLLSSKRTKIRWETIHSISLIAKLIPEHISSLIPIITNLIRTDKSTIVRDYSIETICQFAMIGEKPALTAFQVLKDSLLLWEGKHRARILKGMKNVCLNAPSCILEIRGIAEEYIEDHRSSVRKEAKALVKMIDKERI